MGFVACGIVASSSPTTASLRNQKVHLGSLINSSLEGIQARLFKWTKSHGRNISATINGWPLTPPLLRTGCQHLLNMRRTLLKWLTNGTGLSADIGRRRLFSTFQMADLKLHSLMISKYFKTKVHYLDLFLCIRLRYWRTRLLIGAAYEE